MEQYCKAPIPRRQRPFIVAQQKSRPFHVRQPTDVRVCATGPLFASQDLQSVRLTDWRLISGVPEAHAKGF